MMQTQLLDVARGAYARLSPGTRARLGRIAALGPERLKWGPAYRQWRSLIETTRDDPRGVRDYQHQARLKILSAAMRSRYYRELFETVFGPDVEADQLLDDQRWTQIP